MPGAGASSRSSSSGCSGRPTRSTVPLSVGAPADVLTRRPCSAPVSPSAPVRAAQASAAGSGATPISWNAVQDCPLKCASTSRRIWKKTAQPNSACSNWLSQSSVLRNQLWTTRTTQLPPDCASIVHSVATGGDSGPMSRLSATKRRGGSQAVTVAAESILLPGPKCETTLPPSPSWTSLGTNQDEMPGPVAIACQTSSGLPGTSTSTWTQRRPSGSLFTGMLTPPLHLPPLPLGEGWGDGAFSGYRVGTSLCWW